MFRKLNPNLLLALGLVLLGGCASTTVTALAGKGPAAVAEFRPGYLLGYLPPTAALNSLALLPAAPAAGSAAQALDDELSTYTLGLHGSRRWQLAAADAVLTLPEAAATFSCAATSPLPSRPHLIFTSSCAAPSWMPASQSALRRIITSGRGRLWSITSPPVRRRLRPACVTMALIPRVTQPLAGPGA